MQEVVRKVKPDELAIPPQLFQDEAYRGVSVMPLSFVLTKPSPQDRALLQV